MSERDRRSDDRPMGGRDAGARRSLRSVLVLAVLVATAFGAQHLMRLWSADRLGASVAAHARAGDIRMVSSVTCVYCAQARAWFDEYRVPFTECYIERDADCAATYRALLTPGTPVLLVRGTVQRGFDARKVAAALVPAPLRQ